MDEESAFWTLCNICEDYIGEYYRPSMVSLANCSIIAYQFITVSMLILYDRWDLLLILRSSSSWLIITCRICPNIWTHWAPQFRSSQRRGFYRYLLASFRSSSRSEWWIDSSWAALKSCSAWASPCSRPTNKNCWQLIGSKRSFLSCEVPRRMNLKPC